MNQVIASHCFYCKRPVNPPLEFCPYCHYPVSPAKEEEYLASAIAALQQAMRYGGAQLRVIDLCQRYQQRLHTLQSQKTAPAWRPSAPAYAPPAAPSSQVPQFMPPRVTTLPLQPAAPPALPALPTPAPIQRPRQAFSLRSFLADQAITIVASLGAFLILVGALSFVTTTSNLLLAFLVVFGIHAVFGITGVVTRRFASLRIVAGIYTIIFALLVPLVGFSAYRMLAGNHLALSLPVLIAISSAYAAAVYIMLALFQRYTPFAYLGMVALAVSDLALAGALNLAYWWWPSMLMALALISLVSLGPSSAIGRVFAGNRAILRQPLRIFTYVFAGICTLGLGADTLYSVALDTFSRHSTQVGYAILCLSLLLLLWAIGYFRLARQTHGAIALVLLFLICVLACCYALQFDATGYALTLTAVALLYAGLSRFAVQLLRPFGSLELELDCIALVLVLLVPFIASPTLALQLVSLQYTPGAASRAGWQTFAALAAITAGLVLVLSIAFKRGAFQLAWRWLLLGAAFLFTYAFSLVILALHLAPVWPFLAASLAFMAGAVVVRARIDDAWADPLDVSALFMLALTLGFSVNEPPEIIAGLLLFFFAATYAILLYQRRPTWLFVPAIFALLAIPALFHHPIVLLALGVAFPLAAAVMRDFLVLAQETIRPNMQHPSLRWVTQIWEWPLLAVGLVYGAIVATGDIVTSTSVTQSSLGIPCPVAAEVMLFAVSWYASAALARAKVWLTPALAFALGAILFPTNSFWPLVSLAPALAILAVVVRRFAGNAWSAPFAVCALFSGIMVGYTGFTQQQLAPGAVALLAFALLAYVIAVIEDSGFLGFPMWITPFFATWSAIISAGFLNDPYRPAIVAIVAAALGIIAGRVIPLLPSRAKISPARPQFTWSWPWYATALLAALLTSFWPQGNPSLAPLVAYSTLGFAAFALLIMLVERVPELLIFPVGFAARAIWIWSPQPDATSLLMIYTLLCVLVFTTQFIWRVLPPAKTWLAASTLPEALGIGGQALLVIAALLANGFSAGAGMQAQVGPLALFVLAALIFFYGLLRPGTVMLSLPSQVDEAARLRRVQAANEVQRCCIYISGLLLSLVVSWELAAFHQTRLDVLLLAPASYLTVIAPFLMRDSLIKERHVIGQIVAVLGACLLFLPALQFSLSDQNLLPTAILLGESLALLALGVITRVRIFVLSSAALVIVGTLRALFLATPPSLTLMLTGLTLLVIATVLILARHKLQIAWKQWE